VSKWDAGGLGMSIASGPVCPMHPMMQKYYKGFIDLAAPGSMQSVSALRGCPDEALVHK